MSTRRGGGWRAWSLGSLALALAARLLAGPLALNYYDTGYALLWGRQILHGHLPDYRTPGASTPHPLGTLLATLAAAFGTAGAWYVVQAVVFLSLGVSATALFMLTRSVILRVGGSDGRLPGRRATVAGGVAVGVLVLSPPFLTDAVGGSGLSDLPALALVLVAAALAIDRPERRRTPLVLLGLAGLMRPEAWGLAGAYWLYLAYRRRPRSELIQAAALVLAAPILWGLADALVVGNPTYSLTNTQAASHTGLFAHGIGQVPSAALRDLRALVGLPVLVVGSVGALAGLGLARRATAPALGLLGLALAEFAALGLLNVPLLERFLLLAAAMICLFFAFAVLASREPVLARLGADRPWPGRIWTVAAAVLVTQVAVSHVAGAAHIRRGQRAAVQAEADLLALAMRVDVRMAVTRCPAFYVPRFTLTSLAAFDFDLPPRSIRRTADRPPLSGLILLPATAQTGLYFGINGERLHLLGGVTAAAGPPLVENRSWRLYARACPH